MTDDRDEKAGISSRTSRPDARSERKAEMHGRENKAHIGAYLDPGFRRSLRMVQAQTDKDLQELLAEALNDLFRKYNVTTMDSDD